MQCQVDGCLNTHFAKQFCMSHYFKNYRKTDEYRKKASKYQLKYYHEITKNNPESAKHRKENHRTYQQKWRKINPEMARKQEYRHYNRMLKKMKNSLFSVKELAFSLIYWRRIVKKRDNYRCQICGSRQNLVAHHIFQKAFHPELCLNFNNGITLCKNCHFQTHGQLLVLSYN